MEEWLRCNAYLNSLAGELAVGDRMTSDAVVAHKAAPAAKKRYREAFERNVQRGRPPHMARVSMFIKVEKWPVSSLETQDDGAYNDTAKPPRGIQHRSYNYCAELSTYLLPIELKLWKYLDRGLCPFSKVMNSFAVASTIVAMASEFSDPVFILLDHAKFDSCVTTRWIQLEENFYMHLMPDEDLLALMGLQYENRGYTKNGIRYSCVARKMSGEYNTGLGNTVINYTILEDVFRNVTHRTLLNGDDSVVVMEAGDVDKVDFGPEVWKKYGFRTKCEVVTEIEQVDFCQCRPIQIREGVWRMVRAPARAISRSSVSVKRYEGKAWYSLVAAIGHSELACGDGVPMMQAWAQAYLRASLGATPMATELSRRARLESSLNPTVKPVTLVARDSFERAFGFNAQQQVQFEEWCGEQLMEVLPATRPDDRLSL